MKKLVTMATIAGVFALVSCGPSAEEKAKEAHMKDSLRTDSMNQANAKQAMMMKAKADSTMKAHSMDSARMADSAAKAAPKK